MATSDYEIQQAIRASRAASLQSQFPQLLPGTGRGGVMAAKNIRIELKLAFPGVKFSVTSDYSSVNVRWTDGPTTNQVDAIVSKYKAGRFDGMTDCYEYDRGPWGEAFGDAQYVFTSRKYSDALLARVIARVAERFGAKPLTVKEYHQGSHWIGDCELRRALSRHTCSLPKVLLEVPAQAEVIAVSTSTVRH